MNAVVELPWRLIGFTAVLRAELDAIRREPDAPLLSTAELEGEREMLGAKPQGKGSAARGRGHAEVLLRRRCSRREEAFARFASRWRAIYTDAVACPEKHDEALVAFVGFPENGWVSLRTTNLVERLNKEFKRRTGPMEIVAGKASVYRILAFVAIKMESSWREVPFRNSGFRKLERFSDYFTHVA